MSFIVFVSGTGADKNERFMVASDEIVRLSGSVRVYSKRGDFG
jgi:hypothetical protein